MSDYSFLKTGFSNIIIEPTEAEKENIEIMLGLFTSNALINASKYVNFCDRNGITKTDILYGLQYEVFEFLQRHDLQEGLDEIRKDYQNLKLEEFEMEEDEDNDEEYQEINMEDLNKQNNYDYIEDEELKDFVLPSSEVEEFSRISENKITEQNKVFIDKIHKYNNDWNDWIPQTDLERILKTAIDNIN